MERYTIDIDKVLDDFEETEALNKTEYKHVDGTTKNQPDKVNSGKEININDKSIQIKNTDIQTVKNTCLQEKNSFCSEKYLSKLSFNCNLSEDNHVKCEPFQNKSELIAKQTDNASLSESIHSENTGFITEAFPQLRNLKEIKTENTHNEIYLDNINNCDESFEDSKNKSLLSTTLKQNIDDKLLEFKDQSIDEVQSFSVNNIYIACENELPIISNQSSSLQQINRSKCDKIEEHSYLSNINTVNVAHVDMLNTESNNNPDNFDSKNQNIALKNSCDSTVPHDNEECVSTSNISVLEVQKLCYNITNVVINKNPTCNENQNLKPLNDFETLDSHNNLESNIKSAKEIGDQELEADCLYAGYNVKAKEISHLTTITQFNENQKESQNISTDEYLKEHQTVNHKQEQKNVKVIQHQDVNEQDTDVYVSGECSYKSFQSDTETENKLDTEEQRIDNLHNQPFLKKKRKLDTLREVKQNHEEAADPYYNPNDNVYRDDNDSGVSSEEETSSPLCFFNNKSLNCDSRAENKITYEGASASNFVDNVDKKEVSNKTNSTATLSLSSSTGNDNLDKIPSLSIFPSSSAIGCQSPIKYTGARPKIEAVNPLSMNLTHEETSESNFTDEEIKCDIKNNIDTITEEQSIEVFDNHSTDSLSICNKSENMNSENLEIAIEKNDEPTNEIVHNSNSINTSAESESVQDSNLKLDNYPHRLPRPTTLDLPIRNMSASQTSEVDVASECINVQPQSTGNFIPFESSSTITVPGSPSAAGQLPQIGFVKPFWIPDADAPNCMHCGIKFTVIKRRHHCRACGKVLCSRCCNLKAKLPYLNKEDRICNLCFDIISSTMQSEVVSTAIADSQSSSSCGSSPSFSPSPQVTDSNTNEVKNMWRPHPNNPDDYCSTIPPLQQVESSGTRPPPTVLVPIGVLKRGSKTRKEPKQVIFSDGIRPGGDLTDLTEPTDSIPIYRRIGRKRVEKALADQAAEISTDPSNVSSKTSQRKLLISDEEGPLPAILLDFVHNDVASDESLEWKQILEIMQQDDAKPINFALVKNVQLFIKITKLDCCYGKECWCFTSHGLSAFGQDEIMVILERLPSENSVPRGIIKLYTHIYDCASKGSSFDDLGHVIFPGQILGSSDHRGFLFVRPSFQCLSKLVVPSTPYLVAILIHKWEVPWAKVFPLRLMLRLGAECRYYPCALVSIRHRKPVFFEIGQTIMSVLADLRNYQFTIPVVPGLVVHMEEKKTTVNIPRNRYDKVIKVLNNNNVEHVLALGSNFSTEADSHLVCMQKEEGDYQTQAINIENTTRKVTGASFIVFSGALKTSSGLSAKFSIVEDGLLVQIPQETMVSLHMALRDMKDLTIACGQINATEPEEVVIIQWTKDDRKINMGVKSPIDNKSLEGIPYIRIHNSTDYAGENFLIRWTEVFFLEVDGSGNTAQHELVDPCRIAETVAQSCCMTLAPYLESLADSGLTKVGLRVTLDSEQDKVEYDIGACGKPLPAIYMNALDCGLIPVILRLSGSAQTEPVAFELIFHILVK